MDHDKIRPNLPAYKDGELDEALRDQVARHLEVCDACREELRELDQIDSSGSRVTRAYRLGNLYLRNHCPDSIGKERQLFEK